MLEKSPQDLPPKNSQKTGQHGSQFKSLKENIINQRSIILKLDAEY